MWCTYDWWWWWPDKVVTGGEALVERELPEMLIPIVIVWAFSKLESSTVPKKFLEFGRETTTEVLWSCVGLFALEDIMRFFSLWSSVPCPT